MPHRVADRVLESTTTTGTGPLALAGAVIGHRRFNAIPGVAVNDTVPYFAEAVDSNGVPTGDWECGVGTYSAANELTRTTVLASSNAGAAVNFAAGTKYVGVSAVAAREVYLDHQLAMPLPLALADPPATPAADVLALYAHKRAGRMLPFMIGPSGVDTALQVGLHGNAVALVAPANGTTAPTQWGINLTTATTISHQQTIASANPWQATRRTRYQSSTTAGTATGCRTAYVQWFLGNAAGYGGFWFRAQFGQNINLNGGQSFVGLCASTAALGGDPSALLNMIGVGYDAGDANTGNWFLMRNDGAGSATKVDLGSNAARNTTHGYDLIMFARPNSSEIFVRVRNLHSSVTVLDTSYTSDVPAVNTGLALKAECRNGAVAAAHNIELAKLYIESDF